MISRRVKIPENHIRDFILEYINRHRWCEAWKNERQGAYNPKAKVWLKDNHAYAEPSTSDICGVWNGYPLYIEVKRPKTLLQTAGLPSEGQVKFIENMKAQGSIAMFAWTLEDFLDQTDELIENAEKIKKRRVHGTANILRRNRS